MKNTKILIVEDEGIVAQDIQRRLKQIGYDVPCISHSGEKAIEKAGEIFPDLILMDIRLKGEMDGVEAARRIYNNFNIPIIYLTANVDEKTIERAKATEPFGYIIKPFKERELYTTIEITLAKHRMEKKLKESEQWLTTVLKSIGEAVITSDCQGNVTFINPIGETLTDWKQSEALGIKTTEVFNITDQETRNIIENLVLQVMGTNNVINTPKQTILIAKNSRKIPIDYSVAPIKDNFGKTAGVVLVFQDISDRQQAEEDIRNALHKEKELNELKSRFVSMTSHEFRTPLSTILSSAELLEHYSHKWGEERKLNHLQRIQGAVKHMAGLLDDVLLIGKAEAGKLEFKPTLLDLAQFCHELVEEMQLTANTHKINFRTQIRCFNAEVDEKLLRHILGNLLSNAIKYSPQGSTVDFELVCQPQAVTFSIRDRGIGIPSVDLAQLFNSFHRGSNVGTISGTGLGLAIVKKAVDLHQGEISVTSEIGIGTTFKVILPLNF